MGEWCGPIRHRWIENRGALSEITDHGVEKREQEKFSQECLCLLTCLLMGDPFSALSIFLQKLLTLSKARVTGDTLKDFSSMPRSASINCKITLQFNRKRRTHCLRNRLIELGLDLTTLVALFLLKNDRNYQHGRVL